MEKNSVGEKFVIHNEETLDELSAIFEKGKEKTLLTKSFKFYISGNDFMRFNPKLASLKRDYKKIATIDLICSEDSETLGNPMLMYCVTFK